MKTQNHKHLMFVDPSFQVAKLLSISSLKTSSLLPPTASLKPNITEYEYVKGESLKNVLNRQNFLMQQRNETKKTQKI